MYGLVYGYELDRYRVQVDQGWVKGAGRTPVGIFLYFSYARSFPGC